MNEQELVQRALIDVAQDPSSYYQGFVEDQLPLTKNINEEQFVSLFSTGDETKTKKVLQELASDKKALTSIVKKFQQKSQASVFKEGGKFNYLKKLQGGGVTSEKLQGDLKPKGFRSLFFEATRYPREDGRPGYISEYVTPAGDTTTTVAGRWNQWQRIAKNGQQPTYQIAVGSEDYKPTLDQEAIEMLNNVHNRFYYPVKKQEGGRLKRRDMFEQANANRGFNREQAITAYKNARMAGLDKEAAMQAVIGQPVENVAAERPTLINNITAPIGQAIATQEMISARPVNYTSTVIPASTTQAEVSNLDKLTFGNAFSKARSAGLSEFTWNGKRYTTELSNNTGTTPKPTQRPVSKPVTTITTSIPVTSTATTTPNTVTVPADTTNVVETNEPIWTYNEPNWEYQDPKFVQGVKKVLGGIKRGFNALTVSGEYGPTATQDETYRSNLRSRAKETTPHWSTTIYGDRGTQYRKSGGKISEENEANKKYIKASEKAGKEASKKMSDLKAKHKAELKRIK